MALCISNAESVAEPVLTWEDATLTRLEAANGRRGERRGYPVAGGPRYQTCGIYRSAALPW
jgi:hypothetical protein